MAFDAEAVIHQTAQVDVGLSIKDPVKDAMINIIGSVKLLEACKKSVVKKFVYGNTGGVGTGEPKYTPVDENNPIEPLVPMEYLNIVLNNILRFNHTLIGIKSCSLRYANVYSHRQDPSGEGGVVAIFGHRLRIGQISKIFGDGEPTMDFVYVKDVSKANILGLNMEEGCYKVSTGKEISINDLYLKMKKLAQSNMEAEHVPG